MDDLISREKAIEALQEHRNLFCDNTPETFSKLSYAEKSRVDELDMAIATLINLPSAQPDSKETSYTHKALDTISRQAAIDALDKHLRTTDVPVSYPGIISALTEWLNEVPPSQSDLSGYSDKLWKKAYERGKAEAQQRWIPCSERLPENRVDVLICYREWQKYAKRYVYTIVNGWYARKYSVKENVFSEWEMDSDYKEDEDEFYIPEGWYEFTTQGNGDLMNWFINAEVIAWMPLPEPYREEGD